MTDYPHDTASRTAQRAQIRRRVLADAEREAAATGRSLKCSGYAGNHPPKHAGTEGGCRNDGTNCICECHDGTTEGSTT